MSAGRRAPARLVAAALAGACGLGLEVVLVGAAGPLLGFARASALGLGAFVAGWAGGAFLAGRARSAPTRVLLVAGGSAALAGALLPSVLVRAGAGALATVPAAVLALVALSAAGLSQGAFLPALATGTGRVAGLFAANLLGSVGGALWIGSTAVGAFGRIGAGLAAAGAALVAGAVGAWATSPVGASSHSGAERARLPAPGAPSSATSERRRVPLAAGLVVGLATLWTVALEWVLLRLAVLWLGSREPALAALLGAALLALAGGAALLPPLLPRDSRGVALALALAVLAGTWPLVCLPLLSERVAAGGSELGAALLLVGPALAPLGAVVPLLHRALGGPHGARRRLGGLLAHEGWAALAAGPLAHWGLVPWLGLGGTVAALPLLGLPAGLALAGLARGGAGHPGGLGGSRRGGLALAGLALAVALGGLAAGRGVLGPAARERVQRAGLAAPVFRDPALELRSYDEDAEFCVAVVQDGLLGERTLLTDTFRAAGDGRDYLYMRALGHLPVLLHPRPERVAVLALGTGTTLGAVALHAEAGGGPRAIDVLELSAAVVAQAGEFAAVNGGALDDPRVRVVLGDGRRSLAARPAAYDVVTIEPLLPDSPFGVYLYTEGFYAVVSRALAPGGLTCQWVPPHALEPAAFDAVLDAFRRSFPWCALFTFGSQVVLVGGERAPGLGAGRFPSKAGPLTAGLAALGLGSPAALAARFVSEGSGWPESPRRLTDGDPWIVFGAKPAGPEALAWLPGNLERVGRGRQPPPTWLGPPSAERAVLARSLAALLAARVAQAPGGARARARAHDIKSGAGGGRPGAGGGRDPRRARGARLRRGRALPARRARWGRGPRGRRRRARARAAGHGRGAAPRTGGRAPLPGDGVAKRRGHGGRGPSPGGSPRALPAGARDAGRSAGPGPRPAGRGGRALDSPGVPAPKLPGRGTRGVRQEFAGHVAPNGRAWQGAVTRRICCDTPGSGNAARGAQAVRHGLRTSGGHHETEWMDRPSQPRGFRSSSRIECGLAASSSSSPGPGVVGCPRLTWPVPHSRSIGRAEAPPAYSASRRPPAYSTSAITYVPLRGSFFSLISSCFSASSSSRPKVG